MFGLFSSRTSKIDNDINNTRVQCENSVAQVEKVGDASNTADNDKVQCENRVVSFKYIGNVSILATELDSNKISGIKSITTLMRSRGKTAIDREEVVEQTHKQTTKVGIVSKLKNRSKTQTKRPHHPNTNYARSHQLMFDFWLKLDGIMEEVEAKGTMVVKFRAMIEK